MSVGAVLGPAELPTVALTFGDSGHCFDSEVIEMYLGGPNRDFAFLWLEARFLIREVV